MTPYSPGQDVFQTQADQRFNAFTSPLNPVNANPGQWGVDPAYLTPSYASPYRPRYQGPQGNQDAGYKPGWFKSMNHVFNPFETGGVNYGGNTYQQNRSYYDAIGMRPIDASAGMMQSLAVPIAVSLATFKHLSKPGAAMGGAFGSGLIGGMAQGSFSPATASRLASMGGAAGRLAGGFALPLLAAQGAVSGIDAAIFDPYMAQRGTADAMRRNTVGLTYGDGTGNLTTGGGMSRFNASQQAGQIGRMAAKDPTFSQMEVSQLSDFAGRAGLFDNVQGGQISKRMAEITRQVKVVMAVANTSDFKEAIEIMSKLQTSGVGAQRLSATMGAIGGLASAAGMSTQRLMNTVGMQGQYLFGANGMTPYVGQITAGQAAASFGTAFRSGLMSPALMARMGGVEGASQSANAGLLASLQSPYSTIVGLNAMGTGATGNIVGNMTKFGGGVAGNPLANIGNMNLLRPSLLSNLAEKQGIGFSMERLREMGQNLPGAFRNGKMDAGTAYMIMTGMMGNTDDQARAMLEQVRSNQSPDGRRAMNASFDRAQQDFFLKFADQNSMNKGVFTRPYNAIANLGRSVQANTSDVIQGFNNVAGGFVDRVERSMYGALYGRNATTSGMSASAFGGGSVSQIDTTKAAKHMAGKFNSMGMFMGTDATPPGMDDISHINKMAAGGDETAIALMNSTDKVDIMNRLYDMAERGAIPAKYKDKGQASLLADTIAAAGTTTTSLGALKPAEKVRDAIEKATGVKGTMQGAEVLSLADKLKKNPKDEASMKRLGKLLGRSVSRQSLEGELDKIFTGSATYGTYNVGEAFGKLGSINSEKIDADIAKYGISSTAKRYGLSGNITSKEQLLAELASKDGKNILEQGLDPSKTSAMTPKAAQEYISGMKGIQDQRAKLDSLAKNGFINFDTYTSGQNALDNREVNMKFDSAVEKFGSYVETLVRGKAPDGGGQGSPFGNGPKMIGVL